MSVVANIDVVLRDSLGVRPDYNQRLVLSTYIGGIFVALLVGCCSATATTLIGMVNGKTNTLTIAADGLGSNAGRNTTHERTCKIFVTPSCILGFAGHIWDAEAVYDIRQLAMNACYHPGSLREKAKAFGTLAYDPLMRDIEFLRKTQAQYYSAELAGKLEIIDVFFAGIENGRAIIFPIAGYVRGDTIEFKFWTIDGVIPTDLAIAGFNETASKVANKHADWPKTTSLAKRLIEIEISKNPQFVGPPIAIVEGYPSIMTSDPNRLIAHWVERGACQQND